MRRYVLVAACAIAGAISLAACDSSSSGPAPSPGSTSAPSPQNSALSGTVVVFAAASLKDAFGQLASAFQTVHPGVKVVASFGGSDTLAAQIISGAPVDVFAGADTATMATVTKAGDVNGTPVVFAKNTLEIVVPPLNHAHIATLADLTKPGVKLALCAPTVPCGSAADKVFAAANLTPHPVTLEQNVTAVLTKVELGEVDAGLVYQTDAKAAGTKVAGIPFPEASSAVNTYQIAIIKTGKNAAAGEAFLSYVLAPIGQAVLRDDAFQQP